MCVLCVCVCVCLLCARFPIIIIVISIFKKCFVIFYFGIAMKILIMKPRIILLCSECKPLYMISYTVTAYICACTFVVFDLFDLFN